MTELEIRERAERLQKELRKSEALLTALHLGVQDEMQSALYGHEMNLIEQAFRDVLFPVMKERDEWKRRAEKHGCDIENGDPDCG